MAFWVEEPGVGALRRLPLAAPAHGEVLVRTLFTGVSRGTESTVFAGRVPEGQRALMRAPFQEGEFPGPVKYGYLNVGVVEQGPPELTGRTVFTLFPHQSVFVAPASAVVPVPEAVPPRRAVLAGVVETAVNILWDAAPLVGDRITVVGAGMVGCCVARLARGLPGTDVTLVDVEPSRRRIADALGVHVSAPESAPHDRDLVINTSGSEAGLRLALQTVVTEGVIIEASWYGDRGVSLPLGEDFHSRRLTIRSSQVGVVPPARRDRRSTTDRLALALDLLRDPAFDDLLTGESSWRTLPDMLAQLSADPGDTICHTIDWRDA
ncbi:zinc-binding alcohol dehydrogenase [Leifsonia shinshuensis]|nr:zinc-binding alcohol dehydrogenase [Leifsonia shinshuensis]